MESEDSGRFLRMSGKMTVPASLSRSGRRNMTGRVSKASTSTPGKVHSENDLSMTRERTGARSFDDVMLGGAEDDLLPPISRRSKTNTMVYEQWASSIAGPVTEAAHDAVNARFGELAASLVKVLSSALVDVSRACMQDMYQELALQLTTDLGTRLSAELRRGPAGGKHSDKISRTPSASPSLVSMKRPSQQSDSNKNMEMNPSKSTLQPSDESSRDVKALEGALADALLEESGLQGLGGATAAHSQKARVPRRKKTREGTTDSTSSRVNHVTSGGHQDYRPQAMDVASAAALAATAHMAAAVAKLEDSSPKEGEIGLTRKIGTWCRGASPGNPPPFSSVTPTPVRNFEHVPCSGKLPGSISFTESDLAGDGAEPGSQVVQVQAPATISPLAPPEECERIQAVAGGDMGEAYSYAFVPERSSTPCRTTKSSGRHMTTGEVLQVRVQELTEEIPIAYSLSPSDDDSDDRGEGGHPAAPPLLLKVCGFTPITGAVGPRLARAYQVVTLIIPLLVSGGVFAEMILARYSFLGMRRSCHEGLVLLDGSGACWRQRGLLSDMSLAISLVMGLLMLGTWRGSRGLVNTMALLQSYAHMQGVTEKCQVRARRELRLTFVLWVCAVVIGGAGVVLDASVGVPSAGAVLSYLAHAYMIGTLSCLSFCLIYVCRVLTMCADSFCCKVVDDPDLASVVHEWNVLQAVLRKTSSAIEATFIAVLFGAVLYAPLLMVDFFVLGANREAIVSLLPGLIVFSGLLRLFFLAAGITDKCTRIPPLMNSLSFGPGTERYRQYIVDYITNSAAGFYLCDTRLNMGMVLKFIYVWGVIAFGLGTQVLSS